MQKGPAFEASGAISSLIDISDRITEGVGVLQYHRAHFCSFVLSSANRLTTHAAFLTCHSLTHSLLVASSYGGNGCNLAFSFTHVSPPC
jgi:hypothetical protein